METKQKKDSCEEESGIDLNASGAKARLERATVSRQKSVKKRSLIKKKQGMFLVSVSVLIVVLVVALMVFLADSAEGMWEVYSIERGEKIIEAEDLEDQYGGKILYNLKNDGTLVVEQLGQEIETTWSEEGDTVYFHYSSGLKELHRDGDTMVLEQNGAIYTFIR